MDTSPTVDEILATLAPSKSKPTYDRAWNSFLAFLKSGNEGDETEQDLEGNKENADQDDPGDAGVEAGQVGGCQPYEEGISHPAGLSGGWQESVQLQFCQCHARFPVKKL